ncbi:hypothetical protein V494_01015 [Pseudogymnoascus sp. VKM F-4513 (FW-928)]|nr:hypothetical protein V494_01015 [Pseudogymnoascus sp. VKM F-4513 (FW-928)]
MDPSDKPSAAAQNAGQSRHSHSTWKTKPKPGQQICQNYIRGFPCYNSKQCRYFHDEQARNNWLDMKQIEKKASMEARSASKMSDTTKQPSSSITVPSEPGTMPTKQIVTKSTGSQDTSASDTSPSMASTATTPPTDYVMPHLRNKSNGSSKVGQTSSLDSSPGKLSFNEWNQHRAEIAASFTPRVAESTAMIGGDHLDGVLKYKTDILSSKSGIVQTTAKKSAPNFTNRLPVGVPKNIDSVVNGIAATAGFLPFGAGAGAKPEGITDEMLIFMKEREMKNMSVSTISSESSRASRQSLNITAKVMGFIHRRVNTGDSPAPFGPGHPVYDAISEKPRVCLPDFGNRQTSPKKPQSLLGPVQSAVGLGIVHEAPLGNPPNTPSKYPAALKYVSPPEAAAHDNSAYINAWLDAEKFIAADDKAIEEAYAIKAKEASSRNRVEIVSKYIPRLATGTNSSYGKALSEDRISSLPAFPVASDAVVVNNLSNELTGDSLTINVGKTSANPEDLSSHVLQTEVNPHHQVQKESANGRPAAATKSVVKKAELCINYVRGFPCYYGSECDRYHDEQLRNNTMLHPCVEYNSGQLCHNRKFCTLYHDIAVHNKNRKELMAPKAAPVASGSHMAPMNAQRCIDFALGYACPREPNCTLYHDTVFRNATRFTYDVCFKFLLELPCSAETCAFRHDIDLRDTLNGVRSYRSMPFMDGACSNKTEVSNSENHKLPQELPSMVAPVATAAPVGTGNITPLCFNYILGMRCSSGSYSCRFVHDDGLRTQVSKDTCRNFVLGYPCANGRGCRFFHDVKLRDTLRGSRFRQFSPQDISKVDEKGHLSEEPQKEIQETTNPVNLTDKTAVVRTASIEASSPAKSAGESAWSDFAAHIAAEDSAIATRALSNSSGRSQTSLITIFRDRADQTGDATASKAKNAPKPKSIGTGKKSGSASRAVSITSREASTMKPIAAKAVIESGNSKVATPVVNNARRNTKLTKFCPRFHGGRYHCENGDKCDLVHDLKLQKIYISKDPRYQNAKPPRNGAKTSQWAKNSYDCGAWSLSIVPMAPPAKAKGEFARFPLLPAEIRLRIWEFCLALPYSPIVHQRFRNERSTKPTAKYVCFTRLPPLLETCHESRVEALKYFTLCLGTVTSPPRTYINYEDTFVYLCTRRSGYFIPMMQSLLPVDLANIRCLTLKLRDWLINEDCVFRDAIWKFTSLESLLMLISSREEDEEFRTPVAEHVLMSVLAWQADELNPGFRMPAIQIMVLPGLEVDSDPAEYAPPATRGERIADYFHEREIQALFSSAV